ncbi:MAG TPA: hypothetical protein VGQ63_09420 [Pseudolabrys sp.]|jgi:putative ABC transport system substrate-binding protein|nr:hypothetical protein [Pseudolabrys sp.]
MRRRDFIALLGGTAANWPLVTGAQPSARPVVGFLGAGSPGSDGFRATAVRQGLAEAGYVEGRDITIEYRWAEVDTSDCRRLRPSWLIATST